jgi:hypothetical protein
MSGRGPSLALFVALVHGCAASAVIAQSADSALAMTIFKNDMAVEGVALFEDWAVIPEELAGIRTVVSAAWTSPADLDLEPKVFLGCTPAGLSMGYTVSSGYTVLQEAGDALRVWWRVDDAPISDEATWAGTGKGAYVAPAEVAAALVRSVRGRSVLTLRVQGSDLPLRSDKWSLAGLEDALARLSCLK